MNIEIPLPSEKMLEDILVSILKNNIVSWEHEPYGLEGFVYADAYPNTETGETHFFDVVKQSVFRQVKLGAYGIADVVLITIVEETKKAKDGNLIHSAEHYHCDVFELKNVALLPEHFAQVCRYCSGLNTFDVFKSVRPILIGPSLGGDMHYLCNHLLKTPDDCPPQVYTFKISADGIVFTLDSGSWHMKDPQMTLDSISYLLKNNKDTSNKTDQPLPDSEILPF